ncbi:hypothetical protein [Tenacibaculum litopenaei]|uniref:hypothetical protein n=1 Tax=Tenacibaculum litopenaei TaxID=396016 RepID=UPI0038B422C8
MMTKASDRNFSSRKTVRISEMAIVYGMINSPIFKPRNKNNRENKFFLLLKQFFKFQRAVFAMIHGSVWMYKVGSQTLGFFAIAIAYCSIIGINSIHLASYWKPLAIGIVPVVVLIKPWDALLIYWKQDIASSFIFYYGIVFLVSATVHLVMTWLGKGNSSSTKRGESWLVLILSRYTRVNEYFICGIVEPLSSIGIGLLLWFEYRDLYGCIFMCVIGLSEGTQQLIDQSHKAHIDSILKA